jgi:hypothetical protein
LPCSVKIFIGLAPDYVFFAGMEHLRSPLHDIPWYQQMLLDVIAFLVLITGALVYLTLAFTKFLLRKFTKISKIKSE